MGPNVVDMLACLVSGGGVVDVVCRGVCTSVGYIKIR